MCEGVEMYSWGSGKLSICNEMYITHRTQVFICLLILWQVHSSSVPTGSDGSPNCTHAPVTFN